ncbi:MAG: hypothetical protein D8H91_13585, partial [Alloprevotella sp.]
LSFSTMIAFTFSAISDMIVVLFWMSKIIDLRNYGCKGKPYFQYSQIIREENAYFLRKYPLFVHFSPCF